MSKVYDVFSNEAHHILECSACGEPLVDVWVTKPESKHVWKVKAECPHCGDHSYVTEIHGDFAPGSIGNTMCVDSEITDDLVIFKTVKGKVDNDL